MNNIHTSLTDFSNESRVLKQVDSLVKYGVFENITIIALGSAHLPKFEQLSENISLHRIELLTRGLPKNMLFQTIKYSEFFIKSLFLISKENPSVINAHGLAVLPISLMTKIIFKSHLVYDTHELETETNGLKGFRKKINKFFEKKLIKYVDMTLVVSESIADWYLEEYKIKRPAVVLNAPNYRELKANNHFREQLSIRDDQVILLYQGGLMDSRGVDFILNAFKVRTDDQLIAVFMGYGPLEADIKAAAEQYENIYFFPAVPPQVVLEYTSSADVGIHLIQNTCLNHDYCMPNKLFEYAMAGLPVLVSNMNDMSELVIQNNMGSVITDFSNIGINKALDSFLQNDLIQMKANAYRVACENAWEVQEKKMLRAYKYMFKKSEKNNVHL